MNRSNITVNQTDDEISAYRQLAAAVIFQALLDYANCLYKSSYKEEIDALQDAQSSVESIIQCADEIGSYGVEVIDIINILNCAYIGFIAKFPAVFRSKNGKAWRIHEQINKCTDKESLIEKLDMLKKHIGVRKSVYKSREDRVQTEASRVEDWVLSPGFELYSNGVVTPDDFFKRAKEIADYWTEHGYDPDIFTKGVLDD